MIHKLSNVNFEIFEFDTSRNTRGHSLKLKKKRFNTEVRQHFFTDRIINLWNSLDEQIVSSTSLNCFKNGLEKLRKQHKLMGHVQSCFGYWSPEAEPVPLWWGLDLVSYLVSICYRLHMDNPFLDWFSLLSLSAVDEVMPDRCSVFDWADYCDIEMEKLVLWNFRSLKLFQ